MSWLLNRAIVRLLNGANVRALRRSLPLLSQVSLLCPKPAGEPIGSPRPRAQMSLIGGTRS